MKIKTKKIMIFILTALFISMAIGCNEPTSSSTSSNNINSSENTTKKSSDTNNKNAENKLGKVLVVYFSHTGNTKKLAEKIQGYANADIAEIKTVKPYTDDYNALLKQAKKEQADNYKPKINVEIKDINSYDLIIVGSPLWWSQMTPPVKTFLSENDLSNKKVALFFTHGGSGLADSEKNLKKLCPKSTIQKSLAVNGEKVPDSDNEVKEWLNELR